MKNLLFIITTLFYSVCMAQTGSLDYELYMENDTDGVVYTIALKSGTRDLKYENLEYSGTISDIPVGQYEAKISGLEQSYTAYIEILEDTITELYVSIDAYTDVSAPDNGKQLGDEITTSFMNVAWQFGTGIPITTNLGWHNSFNFAYTVGPDFRLGGSPFALGYEMGLEYQQTSFENPAFSDSTVLADRQYFSNFSLPIGFVTSIYAKNRKVFDVGIKYNVPLVARIVEKHGDTKMKTRNVHNWSDVRVFAHLGYWWGFLYAEYRPTSFLKAPYPGTPEFTAGIRLIVPVEMY